jgi:hypothetical protein
VFIQQNSPNRFILPVDFISQISFFIISACVYFEEGDCFLITWQSQTCREAGMEKYSFQLPIVEMNILNIKKLMG